MRQGLGPPLGHYYPPCYVQSCLQLERVSHAPPSPSMEVKITLGGDGPRREISPFHDPAIKCAMRLNARFMMSGPQDPREPRLRRTGGHQYPFHTPLFDDFVSGLILKPPRREKRQRHGSRPDTGDSRALRSTTVHFG